MLGLVLACVLSGGVLGAQDFHWDGIVRNDSVAWSFMFDYSGRYTGLGHRHVVTTWNYLTNLTDHNRDVKTNMSLKELEFHKDNWITLKRFNVTGSKDEKLKRLFHRSRILGLAALPLEKQKEYTDLSSTMTQMYGNTTVKVGGKTMELEPDLYKVMSDMNNASAMREAWVAWRDAVGRPMRNLYLRFLNLTNEVARANDFTDMSEMRLDTYETPNFPQAVEDLWEQVKPLYQRLHAYVREKLKKKFPKVKFPRDGTIPAHLLGNMWGQSWENVFPFVQISNRSSGLATVTEKMKKDNWNVTHMFRLADNFFKDLGLEAVPDSFFNKSMLVRPENRKVVCHASAWDFQDAKDFRIKMCTEVNAEDFFVIHHEMGHIQYYMLYKNQLSLFREGANPGFHEAVGDLMALSVNTPEHLQKLKLMDPGKHTDEDDLNFLLSMALKKIAFLPFGYLVDRWRWELFNGNTSLDDLNRSWWKNRIHYQGISPPVKRSEQDFDAGAKYHVPADVPYIRYFVSFIIQFQFHEALCNLTGQEKLNHCDIDGHKLAGKRLRSALEKGSSVPWQEVMQDLTGQPNMNASSLLNYFEKLDDWLKIELAKEKVKVGWETKVNSYFSGGSNTQPALLLTIVCIGIRMVFS